VTGTTATYQPTDNLIYTWSNTASVSRPGNNTDGTWYNPYTGNNVDQSIDYQGQWTFYSGTSDAPYVASNGTLSVSSQTNPPVFSEQVTATVNQKFEIQIEYTGYGIGTNFVQTYYYPYDITVTATSSILADNPVTINFGGIVSSSFAVSSNADLILGGPVLTNGSVSFDVNGSLLQQDSAVITAGSLSVNAVGGTVGTATQPLSLAMLNDGPVSATGTQGVYLNWQPERRNHLDPDPAINQCPGEPGDTTDLGLQSKRDQLEFGPNRPFHADDFRQLYDPHQV
jgi:hypothetical protein